MSDKNSGTVKFFADASLMPVNAAMADGLQALGYKRTRRVPPVVTTTRIRNDADEVVAIRIRVETSNRTDETDRLERSGWEFPEGRTVVEL
jgi:hypothetical protein